MRALIRRLLGVGGSSAPDIRASPATKAALRTVQAQWKQQARDGTLCLSDCGLRVFSQFEEDGLILAIFAAIGTTNRVFVDLGAADGIWGNTANLAVNFGWTGLMIDGNAEAATRGRAWYAAHPDTWAHPPRMTCDRITRENVNALIQESGITGEIDLLSIDIDGNDYWVLDAISVVQPRVIIAEANLEFAEQPLTIPYDPAFVQSSPSDVCFGAGAEALRRLCARKGYRLVGANAYANNLLFVRNGIGEFALPATPLSRLRRHPLPQSFDAWPSWANGRRLVEVTEAGDVAGH